MKNIILLIFIGIIILGGFFYWNNSNKIKFKYAEIGGKKFNLETASSLKDREAGLSGRENLCEDCGMLFLFDRKGKYSFWMKDMKFDLDIIWIFGNEIVSLVKNISYENGAEEIINPETFSDKVLEINSGLCDKLNIKVGDKVKFE